jgi:hypothetical protein
VQGSSSKQQVLTFSDDGFAFKSNIYGASFVAGELGLAAFTQVNQVLLWFPLGTPKHMRVDALNAAQAPVKA